MTNTPKGTTNTTNHQATSVDPLNEWRRLNLRVKGQPKHFKNHSQRILFALQHKLHQYLPGALQDLFIALGDSGRPLRVRLYSLVLPLLDQHDREYFHEWLAHDSDATLGSYRFPGSVLISQTAHHEQTEPDPFSPSTAGTVIERSRHAINYGRTEIAQTLLEDACLNQSTRPQTGVVEELLSFYAATRQRGALEQFANYLKQQHKFNLSDHWKQVLESAKEW